MRITLLCISVVCALLPLHTRAEEVNAGFVRGIWYSDPVLFAGEPARVYVALRNSTDTDLTGTIRFNDNGKRIGISYVSALPGRIVEGWVDWTPTYGTHTITATLVDVRSHVVGKGSASVEVESTIAEDTLTVDYDTDHDGLGNEIDTDDDGDGIFDADEEKNGTDPLVPDAPKITETKQNEDDSEPSSDTTRSKESVIETPYRSGTETDREGLEQFTPPGTIDSLLKNVTTKVNSTKDAIDTYRETRNDALKTYFRDDTKTGTPTNIQDGSNPSTSPDTALATITRTRIETDDESFWQSALGAGKALIRGMYTLVLYALSTLLAHPAILELLLLLFILYIIYRTARKLARRPNNN